MPSKSPAQKRLMAAAAHNPKFAKKAGVPTKVAKEYNAADAGKAAPMGGTKGRTPMGGGADRGGDGPMGGIRKTGPMGGRGMVKGPKG